MQLFALNGWFFRSSLAFKSAELPRSAGKNQPHVPIRFAW